MSTIIVDRKWAETLRNCVESAVLRDSEGKIVGYFEPPAQLYEAGHTPDFDEAELDRREERWQGIPSAEIRKQLESLR